MSMVKMRIQNNKDRTFDLNKQNIQTTVKKKNRSNSLKNNKNNKSILKYYTGFWFDLENYNIIMSQTRQKIRIILETSYLNYNKNEGWNKIVPIIFTPLFDPDW